MQHIFIKTYPEAGPPTKTAETNNSFSLSPGELLGWFLRAHPVCLGPYPRTHLPVWQLSLPGPSLLGSLPTFPCPVPTPAFILSG